MGYEMSGIDYSLINREIRRNKEVFAMQLISFKNFVKEQYDWHWYRDPDINKALEEVIKGFDNAIKIMVKVVNKYEDRRIFKDP